ncbi:MAG: C2H2-type zinc finger protein [Flavobacterium sp.]
MDNAKMPKNAEHFRCDLCCFSCNKRSNYICHLNTQKHIRLADDNKMVINDNEKMPKNAEYTCKCGNIYKYMSGLSRHKKYCNFGELTNKDSSIQNQPFNSTLNSITPELVMELIKDNKELKQIIMEQNNTINNLVKNGTNNITNSLNNNNNKTFNLQFFLNETCKDAMNIMEFVDSIKVQLSDLERVGEIGYVQGLSNIITTNLKALDVTQRPVHCTDKKRKTMYIKDDDKWEKEDDNKTTMRKVIKRVANKNIKLLPEYREKNPKYSDSSSRVSDKYDKMVVEIMGGRGDNDMEKEDVIIGNILKCTTIEKYQDA